MVDQDFGRQNKPMIRPPLDSTPFGINVTIGTTSPIDSIPVGKNTRSYATSTSKIFTRGPGSIPIIVIFIIKQISFVE